MKINFLGDSITEGVGATQIETRYVNVVKEMLGCEVKNYGVSGTRFARQSKYSPANTWDYDFMMRMEIMANIDPDADLVFVFGGTNDFGHGDAPLGKMGDKTPYTFYGATAIIVEFLLEKYGREKLCFMLPIRRYHENSVMGDEGNKKEPGATLPEYVAAIKEVLEAYNVSYIDLFNNFIPTPAVASPTEFLVDGLHPNDKGHRMIAEKVVEYVKNR